MPSPQLKAPPSTASKARHSVFRVRGAGPVHAEEPSPLKVQSNPVYMSPPPAPPQSTVAVLTPETTATPLPAYTNAAGDSAVGVDNSAVECEPRQLPDGPWPRQPTTRRPLPADLSFDVSTDDEIASRMVPAPVPLEAPAERHSTEFSVAHDPEQLQSSISRLAVSTGSEGEARCAHPASIPAPLDRSILFSRSNACRPARST